MATQAFTPAILLIGLGDIDFSVDTIDVLLCMTATSAGSASHNNITSIDTIDSLVSLDEFDGSAYVRKALGSPVMAADVTNNRAEFDAADLTWSGLGAGTRSVQGALLFKRIGASTDVTSIGVAYLQFGSPETPNGGDFTIQWNAQGIIQISGP